MKLFITVAYLAFIHYFYHFQCLMMQEHRQTKKAMKLVFKKEKLRQEREMISNPVLNKID